MDAPLSKLEASEEKLPESAAAALVSGSAAAATTVPENKSRLA